MGRMRKRVVITGMGSINPLGHSVAELWEGIKAGNSGIGPITRFDITDYPAKIAGEVKDFKASAFMDKKEGRKMGLFTQYAVAASIEAMNQAGLEKGSYDPYKSAVILGNGIGGFEIIEDAYFKLYEKGPDRIPPMTIPKLISNEGPGNVAIRHQIHGPAYTLTTACASGTDAIGNAFQMIQFGNVDMVITGGTEGCITRLGVGGFSKLGALSTGYNDAPVTASRPFDKDRDGFVIAEGAGILILEELEHAKNRGAKILAEVGGYGMTCDAFHLTAPHPEGNGAVKAMQIAMKDADLSPGDIQYINAHGTSTPTNDPIETNAIKTAFGDAAYKLKVSSTKSMTGHMVGAAGGVEAIISVLSINDNFYPATINFNSPGEGCDLDYIPNKGISGKIDAVMSNSLGFGGHNGVIIVKRYKND